MISSLSRLMHAQETYLANVSIGCSNPPEGENEARLVGLGYLWASKRSRVEASKRLRCEKSLIDFASCACSVRHRCGRMQPCRSTACVVGATHAGPTP